ncbi:MAG: alpha/beta fold hydrolase [Kiritimatiellae bacterium]|nr:alpha/beta fold hydrolase [Kiritimatiellia bacterium]
MRGIAFCPVAPSVSGSSPERRSRPDRRAGRAQGIREDNSSNCPGTRAARRSAPDGFGLRELAEDVNGCMDAVGVSRASVFGASLGGMLAMHLALAHPERVEALVLAATTPRLGAEKADMFRPWLRLAEEGKGEEVCVRMAEAVYSEGFFAKHRNALKFYGRGATAEELRHFVQVARCLREFDLSGRLGEVRCPVLAVGATGDKLFGAEPAEEIARRTGGELIVYQGASHAMYDEEPDFRGRMKAFLDGVARG